MPSLLERFQRGNNDLNAEYSGQVGGVPLPGKVMGSNLLARKALAAQVSKKYDPIGDAIDLGIDRISRGEAMLTGKPIADSLKSQMNAPVEDMAMNWANPSGGMVGMFIGKGAKTWDAIKAAKALEMEAAGNAPEAIWRDTGTFRGADKQLRQEIDDSIVPQKMQLKEKTLFSYPEISKSVPHKELFEGYPDLADIKLAPNYGSANGAYDHAQNVITLNPKMIGEFLPSQASQAKSTQLHELQHAIQQREGWAIGGSPEGMAVEFSQAKQKQDFYSTVDALAREAEQTFNGDVSKAAASLNDIGIEVTPEHISELMTIGSKKASDLSSQYEARLKELGGGYGQSSDTGMNLYKRLAGEAEARLTQARMKMSALQRAASYPPSMFDVPMDQQIVRMK